MKKLFSRRGLTLAEMLIAVLLLALVSVMAAVMSSAVLSTYNVMSEVSQAELLGTTAMENLSREIRFRKNVRIDKNPDAEDESKAEDVLLFDEGDTSKPENQGFYFNLRDGLIVIVPPEDNIDEGTNKRKDPEPLFQGTLYGDLRISELKFEEDGNAIKIELNVVRNKKVLWSGSVSVVPQNPQNKAA